MCVLGVILPYTNFIHWIVVNGLDMNLMWSEIVNSKLSLFAWFDVIVSAVVLVGFILFEGKKLKMKRLWLPILATFSIGVSLGLPLFLFLRENHINNIKI